MYIYHFWPLCMHCQKTTTIRCFLEATYDLLVVLRKPWICTLCFDAHFSKFRDFWWFWTIFNRKMDILDHFWGPLTASCPKVTIYLPLAPWTLSGPVKNPRQNPIFDHFRPLLRVRWEVADIRPSKMALFELVLFWLKWREKGPKPPPSPFKVALCKLRYKNHHFTLLTPCFWTPIFDLQNKNVDL